ncbi:MAG TPA: hydrogenase 4 subunit F [Rhodospirillaceae bacterium]|nr:MAG: hydrogenase 4 subunit F [Alphaproteobacteria bacterium GWF2_58_20]HAU29767.1 hydrogenase 4 subunit F [Rhodospirillaceae bacterium]
MNIGMINLVLLLSLPIVAGLFLAAIHKPGIALKLHAGFAFTEFLAALGLAFSRPEPTRLFMVDGFTLCLVPLTAFILFTTAWFSHGYLAHDIDTGKIQARHLRLWHVLFQSMALSMYAALVSNNIGVMWVAVEMATLATVILVGFYRTHAALEAAWKYFLLGSVGIALALFGTILLYFAAEPLLGQGMNAMTWSRIREVSSQMDPRLLRLAFVFLLVGYGTKIGFFPLHAWLPDAHAEAPSPMSAALSGLLLNIAFFALLRGKMVLAGNVAAGMASSLLILFGLVSLIIAALMLLRRHDLKRLLAWSSIEHMGIMGVAFGIGGPLGSFAGLLHMIVHSLVKSGLFFAAGQTIQTLGTQKISKIRGLSASHPRLAILFGLAFLAAAGLPPFGLFTSEITLLVAATGKSAWLGLALAAGLLIAFAAIILKLSGMLFGEPVENPPPTHPVAISSVPLALHLAIAAILGLFVPGMLWGFMRDAIAMLG